MKTRLLILLLLITPATSWAWMGIHVAGGGVPAAAAPHWYYGDEAVDDDNYTDTHGGLGNDYRLGDIWTPGINTTITKLGCKAATLYGATDLKITLWENVSGTWTNRRCVEVTGISTGWNDADVTDFSLTSSMEIAVSCEPSTVMQFNRIDGTATAAGFYQGGLTYSTACDYTNMSPTTNYIRIGVRFYGE